MSGIVRGPALDPRIAALTGETLVELLDRAAARTPDRVALVQGAALGEERWTYRQLAARAAGSAATLHEQGVRHGDRVVIWGPSSAWLVAALFGAWRSGAVVVPLDLRMADGVALRIAGRTEPALVLAGPAQAAEAALLGAPVLGLDAASLGAREGAGGGAGDPDRAAVHPDDLAEIVFTSGTSSDPKGVMLTHAQIIHAARMIAQTGMGRAPDRALAVIPLSHLYGQIVPLFLGLVTGSTLVFARALTPTAMGAALRHERITAITAVPAVARLLMEGIEAEAARRGRRGALARARVVARVLPLPARRRLFRSVHAALGGHLSVITSGGALLPPELQAAWEELGVRVVQGYGATECAAIAGHTRDHRTPGSAGRVLAGLEVRLADDGELQVRGPAVMSGYWRAPEATAEVLDADGWLHTGDAAAIDPDGEVRILGRTRDRIALPSGLKVYPEDVEAALTAGGVIRAAVVLEADPGRLAAVLVPTDPEAPDATLAAAVKAANSGLAPHQRVSAWRRWPDTDLPRTHTLKVRRQPVAAWLRTAPSSDPASGGPPVARVDRPRTGSRSPLAAATRATGTAGGSAASVAVGGDPVAILCALVAEVASVPGAPFPAVRPETRLDTLGLDSLGRVTLALRIEDALDAALTDDEIATAGDVRDLAALAGGARGRPEPAPPAAWALSRPASALRRILDATVTRALVDVVARPRAVGLEHLPADGGPFLICPDHTSHLDVPSVRRVLPAAIRGRVVVAAAADYFFTRRLLGPTVALAMGAVPFGRSRDVLASLERVADLLGDGHPVILFPEGTRSPDGRPGPMRHGIGLLATATGVPIVPANIAGAHAILPKGRSLPRRRRGGRVVVRFGPPLWFSAGTPPHEVALAVGTAIAALRSDEGAVPRGRDAAG